tara:strand:+ start:9489 stop:9881 length:393 start_codon:yes stop_codon:yes gene_type:complete
MSIVKLFNEQFFNFVDEIIAVTNNVDIQSSKTICYNATKLNVMFCIKNWINLVLPYKAQIDKEDIEFFKNKDYVQDVKKSNVNLNYASKMIGDIKSSLLNTKQENVDKCFKWFQTLNKLSLLYMAEKGKK